MITEELRKYIDLVKEEWNTDQLFEMATVTSRYHGIENVVIWVGKAPRQHGLRIKVSRVLNKMSIDDSFVIMMPSLDYDPSQVPQWLTSKMMNKILEWIKSNQKLLYDYENGIIDDTGYFLDNIAKV